MDRDEVIRFLDDYFFGPKEQYITDIITLFALLKDEDKIEHYEKIRERIDSFRLYIQRNLI